MKRGTQHRPQGTRTRASVFLLLGCVTGCGDSAEVIGGAGGGVTTPVASAGTGGRGTTTGASGSAPVQDGTGGSASEPSGRAGSSSSPAGAPEDGPRSRLDRYHGADGDAALVFELDAVTGLEAYASSLDYLTTFVGRVLDKPEGVSFELDESLAPFGDDHAWTFSELDAFSREHARDDSAGPVRIHVLLLDGRYDGGEDAGTVLGLAWGQRYIALFQQAIRSGCSGGLLGALSASACEAAERNVWAHEIGHVIGLVDNGLTLQTPHRDPEHGRHDMSDACLMYWAYERPAIFDTLLSRLSSGQSADLDFCENCWADLRAAQP